MATWQRRGVLWCFTRQLRGVFICFDSQKTIRHAEKRSWHSHTAVRRSGFGVSEEKKLFRNIDCTANIYNPLLERSLFQDKAISSQNLARPDTSSELLSQVLQHLWGCLKKVAPGPVRCTALFAPHNSTNQLASKGEALCKSWKPIVHQCRSW